MRGVDLRRSRLGDHNHNIQNQTEASASHQDKLLDAQRFLLRQALQAQHRKTAAKSHGQHGIDGDRTREIQTALIREHYLTGEPTGAWDQSTKDALTRFQAANGWQTKITPDSRALIKLGLGPDHKGLLNPDTASIPSPHELGMDSGSQPGGATNQP